MAGFGSETGERGHARAPTTVVEKMGQKLRHLN